MDPTGMNDPLPPEAPSAEMLIAQGQREQILISQGQLTQLSAISHLLGSQIAQGTLVKFDGDPCKFQHWVRSIGKCTLLADSGRLNMQSNGPRWKNRAPRA